MTRHTFIKWLEVVLFLVLIYSLFLVFAGTTAGSLFSWFGFGPDELIDTAALSCMTKERYATDCVAVGFETANRPVRYRPQATAMASIT